MTMAAHIEFGGTDSSLKPLTMSIRISGWSWHGSRKTTTVDAFIVLIGGHVVGSATLWARIIFATVRVVAVEVTVL